MSTLRWAATHCASASEDVRTIQPAGAAEVEVLDRGGADPELGRPKIALEASVVPVLGLAVDEQAQALLEGERLVVGPLLLVGEGARHLAKVQRVELVEGRVDEHR